MKNDKPVLVYLVFHESHSGYFHCHLSFRSTELDRNGHPESLDLYTGGLQRISMEAQAHSVNLHDLSYQPKEFYAWDKFSLAVDEYNVESTVKALKALRRKMAKMESVEGSVKSFGQLVNRIARAVGCKRVYSRGWTKGTLSEFQWHTLDRIESDVDYKCRAWLESKAPKESQS